MEHGGENGGSEQPSWLFDGLTLALGKTVEKVIEQKLLSILPQLVKPMVTTTVKQEVVPVAEDLFRRVVQEEIQKLLNGGPRNDLSEQKILQMKFLDEVPNTVQTSEELRGIKGDCLGVALVDPVDGQIVRCGPESSAKVEILLLDDNGKDNVTHENIEGKIIRGDKEKPHFNQSVYVYLVKGVGSLSGVKLGQDSGWTKNYNCRLGARIVQIFKGIVVQEAWTAPFKVQDNRNAHAKKHYPPSLSSEVWRLKKIARRGKPRICLEKKGIKTLRDFLFWLNIKSDELKQILDLGDNRWNSTVNHARTCKIDDERMFSHESPTEPQICVIYDVEGNLKGEMIESHFVPFDKLTADRKIRARELLSSVLEPSAFRERYDTSFSNEDSLLKEFSYRSSHTNASTKSSLQHGGVCAPEDISGYRTTERGSSSKSIIVPNNLYNSRPSDSLGSRETGELCNPASGPLPDPQITGGAPLADLGTSGSDYEKHESPSLGLCLENHFVPARSPPENLIKAVGEDMNHLQQHLSSGTSEMVNLTGESSRMVSAGEGGASLQDLGSSYSVRDDMETMLVAETPCNRACQGECRFIPDIFFKGFEDEIKQRFPNVCVGSNSWKWKRLLLIIKWCFSSQTTTTGVPHHHVTGKRKRQVDLDTALPSSFIQT